MFERTQIWHNCKAIYLPLLFKNDPFYKKVAHLIESITAVIKFCAGALPREEVRGWPTQMRGKITLPGKAMPSTMPLFG
jgi:hypothetical protein